MIPRSICIIYVHLVQAFYAQHSHSQSPISSSSFSEKPAWIQLSFGRGFYALPNPQSPQFQPATPFNFPEVLQGSLLLVPGFEINFTSSSVVNDILWQKEHPVSDEVRKSLFWPSLHVSQAKVAPFDKNAYPTLNILSVPSHTKPSKDQVTHSSLCQIYGTRATCGRVKDCLRVG